jgi:hypothetical protein
MRWPVDFGVFEQEGFGQTPADRRQGVVMVASDKVSATHDFYYKLRREIAEHRMQLAVEVVGQNWKLRRRQRTLVWAKAALLATISFKLPRLSAFVRYAISSKPLEIVAVDNKRKFLEGKSIALVIENDPGYVSEKIMETLLVGVIPVYVGPEIPEDWIPSRFYYRSNHDLKSIAEAVSNARTRDLHSFQQDLFAWLSTSQARAWSRDAISSEISCRLAASAIHPVV